MSSQLCRQVGFDFAFAFGKSAILLHFFMRSEFAVILSVQSVPRTRTA